MITWDYVQSSLFITAPCGSGDNKWRFDADELFDGGNANLEPKALVEIVPNIFFDFLQRGRVFGECLVDLVDFYFRSFKAIEDGFVVVGDEFVHGGKLLVDAVELFVDVAELFINAVELFINPGELLGDGRMIFDNQFFKCFKLIGGHKLAL